MPVRHTHTARPGLSLVELLVVVAIAAVVVGLTLSGVQRVRAAAAKAQCGDRLRQLGVAAHGYHAAHARRPAGMAPDKDAEPRPFLSWLARLLPHADQDALWTQTEAAFRADRSFLSPAHPHRATVVTLFTCPADAPSSSRTSEASSRRGRRRASRSRNRPPWC